MRDWLRKNTIVVILAIGLGFFNLLPTILSIWRMGASFAFIWPSFNDDTLVYLARAHELLDGHYLINHPYYYEYKNVLFPQAYLGEIILALLSVGLRLSLPAAQVILEFFAPMIIFILLYFLFYKFSENRFLSLLVTLLSSVFNFDGFGKAVHPQISFPVLVLFIFYLSALYDNCSRKALFWAVTIALGSSYSLYYYNWTYMWVVLGLVAVDTARDKDWSSFKKYLIIFFTSLIFGLPYFMLVYFGLGAAYHTETSVRIGVFHSHLPETLPRLLVALVWWLFFLAFIKFYKLEKERKAGFLSLLLLANIIYPNHQVLSGLIIQNAAHWSAMPVFIYALSSIYVLAKIFGSNLREIYFKNFSGKDICISILAIILFLAPLGRLLTFTWTKTLVRFQGSEVENMQEYSPVFDWINKNTAKDSVFFADERVMRYIPAYTHGNAYYLKDAYYMPAQDQEVIRRTILANIFNPNFFTDKNFGMSASNRLMWDQAATIEMNTNKTALRLGLPVSTRYGLDNEVSQVQKVWQTLHPQLGDLVALNKFRLDYVIWDKNKHADWIVDKQPGFTKIWEKGNISIFKNKFYE